MEAKAVAGRNVGAHKYNLARGPHAEVDPSPALHLPLRWHVPDWQYSVKEHISTLAEVLHDVRCGQNGALRVGHTPGIHEPFEHEVYGLLKAVCTRKRPKNIGYCISCHTSNRSLQVITGETRYGSPKGLCRRHA